MDFDTMEKIRYDPSTSFIAPLQEIENMAKSESQLQRDIDELDSYFPVVPPIVTKEVREAIIKKIAPQKKKLGYHYFRPPRRLDEPDVKTVPCKKLIPCGHPCNEPAALINHVCGRFCTHVITFKRPCGHQTVIYCGRDAPKFHCKEICKKELICGHSCRNKCHPDSCSPTCDDFYCKTILFPALAPPEAETRADVGMVVESGTITDTIA